MVSVAGLLERCAWQGASDDGMRARLWLKHQTHRGLTHFELLLLVLL